MKLMKSWYVPAANEIELIDTKIPAVLTDNQVLVRNISFCICNGSDPGIINGNAEYDFPMIFGHESSGIIEKKGKNVKNFKIGDRVSWWCTLGTFAEYMLVDVTQVAMFIIPENIDDSYSAIMELVIAASRALMPFMTKDNKLKQEYSNKTITILGLGPSGLIALQLAKYLGFKTVYGWDLYGMRRELALKLGIDSTADPSSAEFAGAVMKQTESDIALDMMDDDLLDGENTFNYLITVMKNYGIIVSYGHPEKRRVFKPHIFQGKNITMIAPENNLDNIRKRGKLVMQGIRDNIIKLEPLVTHRYKFDQVKEVFYAMLKNPENYIKIIFTP
ncbi:MAG: alcohol dehydrogenase catalytic domain-containing protein [Oscillospiraceae bacterium]|nr:alcohol dehydrogenase catalytic domain-containing protein [Oscillospiraceae bacterium]